MERNVLLVVSPSDYSGLAFITFDVILKENSIDLVTVSPEGGAAKADDESSTMTVSFKDALKHDGEFNAIVLIGGKGVSQLVGNEELKKLVTDFHEKGKLIVALDEASSLLSDFGISIDSVIFSEGEYEKTAESLASKF